MFAHTYVAYVCLHILILHIICFYFTLTVILLHSSPPMPMGRPVTLNLVRVQNWSGRPNLVAKPVHLRPKLTANLVRPNQFWSRFNTKSKSETEDRRIQNIYKDIEAIENESRVKARQTQ